MLKPWQTWLFSALILPAALVGCASNETAKDPTAPTKPTAQAKNKSQPSQPVPQRIQLKAPGSENLPPGVKPQIIEKDLFNISVSRSKITVNGAAVKDLAALEQLLLAYPKPMITLATHRCLDSQAAAEVMNLAQRHTDIPIAFGAYGDYDDAECQNP